VPPFTRKMSLTFMVASGSCDGETVLRRGRLRGVCGSI